MLLEKPLISLDTSVIPGVETNNDYYGASNGWFGLFFRYKYYNYITGKYEDKWGYASNGCREEVTAKYNSYKESITYMTYICLEKDALNIKLFLDEFNKLICFKSNDIVKINDTKFAFKLNDYNKPLLFNLFTLLVRIGKYYRSSYGVKHFVEKVLNLELCCREDGASPIYSTDFNIMKSKLLNLINNPSRITELKNHTDNYKLNEAPVLL